MYKIRLSLEYECSPIWLVYQDGGVDDIGPESLPISDSLKHDINMLNKVYQGTYDRDVPQNSGLSSEVANDMLSKAFIEEGRSLFKRLKKELDGVYKVTSHKFGD